jgi:hypothetical protein
MIAQPVGIALSSGEQLAGQVIVWLALVPLDEPLAVVPEGDHVRRRPSLILR